MGDSGNEIEHYSNIFNFIVFFLACFYYFRCLILRMQRSHQPRFQIQKASVQTIGRHMDPAVTSWDLGSSPQAHSQRHVMTVRQTTERIWPPSAARTRTTLCWDWLRSHLACRGWSWGFIEVTMVRCKNCIVSLWLWSQEFSRNLAQFLN